MILTDWLPVWNMALNRIGKPSLTSANLAVQTSDEAKKVSLYWDRIAGKVLADHDILVAARTIFLGTETLTLTPTLPVGATELSTDQIRLNYYQLPAYDASVSPAAGTVPFEIVRPIVLSTGQYFDLKGDKLFVVTAVTDQNVYADVIVKPTAAEAGRDDAFVAALYLALAMEIAPQLSGKDQYRDLKLKSEYDDAISSCRYYDNTLGQDKKEPGFWHPLSADTGGN